jgi:hypothetical protein
MRNLSAQILWAAFLGAMVAMACGALPACARADTYLLVAGEVGLIIDYSPNAPFPAQWNPISLSGHTLTMVIQQPSGAKVFDTMTVSEDGNHGLYPTSFGDLVAGPSTFQFFSWSGSSFAAACQAQTADTYCLKSLQITITVEPSF